MLQGSTQARWPSGRPSSMQSKEGDAALSLRPGLAVMTNQKPESSSVCFLLLWRSQPTLAMGPGKLRRYARDQSDVAKNKRRRQCGFGMERWSGLFRLRGPLFMHACMQPCAPYDTSKGDRDHHPPPPPLPVPPLPSGMRIVGHPDRVWSIDHGFWW
jgi:hypothetical protein